MRALHAAWLLVPLAITAVDVQARTTILAQVARPVAPTATMHPRPMLSTALQAARGADNGQAQDAAIDGALAHFAAANAANQAVAAALEVAAAELTHNPEAYLNADGSVNENAMQGLVGQHFRDAGPVSLPSANGADVVVPNLGAIGDGDIEALVMIVLMDAAKAAREDLKAIMEETKALNKEKAAQRDAMGGRKQAMQDAKDAARDDKDAAQDDDEALQAQRDSLSDMGEQQQLRVQMYMDRRSKFMSTLSNLMKKWSETASAIIGNMK